MKKTFAGIAGSPVTPFKPDGSVDYATFERQIEYLIAGGAHLLVHPMHIAESVSLTEAERRELARVFVAAVGGRVPAFVHVSHAGTGIAVDMAAHAAACGATGVVLMAPYFWKSGGPALVEHFSAVAAAGGGRLIAYNNVQASGVELTPKILTAMLERIPGFAAIKDASLSMEGFADLCTLIAAQGRDVAALTASEHLLPSMAVGGDGCVSGCSEIAPRLVHALYEACRSGRHDTARELQRRVGRLLKVVRYNYPVAVKFSMELMGRAVGAARPPLLPLNAEERRWVEAELAATGVFDGEARGWQP